MYVNKIILNYLKKGGKTMANLARIIVIDGTDGSGKQTQQQCLLKS